MRQIGYEFAAFARAAHLVVVDIDAAELAKPTINPNLTVHADVGWFVRRLRELATKETIPASHADWLSWCAARRERYPVVLAEYRQRDSPINPYVFIDELSEQLLDDDVVVVANGTACVTALQALRPKGGQRVIVNSGTAGMGYDLPAAIGAACARRSGSSTSRRVVCLAGDGSIQMNVQELATLAYYELPIKVFVFNNGGYLSIRQTQDTLFAGARFGESSATGVGLPPMVAVAGAFGIKAARVDSHSRLPAAIAVTLATDGPSLLDVVMDAEQAFAPKVIAERRPDGRIVSKPLEDMYPWLDRDELRDNMIDRPLPERRIGARMNALERKMVRQLRDLRENHHVIGVKAEFEAEGTRMEEAMRLKDVVSSAGLGLTMKVGGGEALRDMYEARVIGVERVVGPMIESPYALRKFLGAAGLAFPVSERDDVKFAVNVETVTTVANLDAMLEIPEISELDGVVLGRVDMTGSLGLSRDDVNCQEILDIARRVFHAARSKGLECAIGGGIAKEALPFMRELGDLLDRYETRKVIFGCPAALGDQAEAGILKAVGFELMWLKNKRDFYGSIYEEDRTRIEMLEARYARLIEMAGGMLD